MKPVVYDLFCGLGGWTEAFLAEGYRAVGFDIERHDYGTGGYPGELILRDIRSIHGSELKDAAVIVASPPCQAYSYRAMPWKRAKALPPPDNTLFNECFRIQREASEAAGHYIPLIVENVRGAQKWVGRAQWNYGSFYLWGDVPALMPPIASREIMKRGVTHRSSGETNWHGFKLQSEKGRRTDVGKGARFTTRDCGVEKMYLPNNLRLPESEYESSTGEQQLPNPQLEPVSIPGLPSSQSALYADRDNEGVKQHGSGHIWYRTGNGAMSSKSSARKAASAMIAKIPYPLALHIAQTFKPREA